MFGVVGVRDGPYDELQLQLVHEGHHPGKGYRILVVQWIVDCIVLQQ